MRDAGAAVTLYDQKRLEKPGSGLKVFSFEQPVFTAKKVTECVQEVLSHPKYKEAAMRLRMLSKGMGGRDLMIKTIERHYITGADHLIDNTFNKKFDRLSCCCSCLSILFLLSFIGFLSYFTTLYFMEVNKI